MIVLKIGSITEPRLGSPWKSGYMLNNLRSLDIGAVVVSETRVSDQQQDLLIYKSIEIERQCCSIVPEEFESQDADHLESKK